MKRSTLPPSGGSRLPGAGGNCEEKRWPLLAAAVMDETWDDGAERQGCSISIFRQDGRLKAALNDKDAPASCFLVSETLEGLLNALEEGLSTGGLDWRASTWKGKKK